MENLRNVYFPLLWVDETATIDEKSANLYKSKATIPLLLLDIFSLGFGLGLGSLGLVISLIYFIWNYYRKRQHKNNNQKIK